MGQGPQSGKRARRKIQQHTPPQGCRRGNQGLDIVASAFRPLSISISLCENIAFRLPGSPVADSSCPSVLPNCELTVQRQQRNISGSMQDRMERKLNLRDRGQ
jgi:hypothetical protein